MESAFTIENIRFENKSRRKSLLLTIGFHAAILLIFAFFAGVNSPIPPFEGGGVEVNFGMSEVGSGDIQPMSDEPNIEAPLTKAVPIPVKTDAKPADEIITQTTDDAPEVPAHKAHKKKPDDLVKPIVEKTEPNPTTTQPEVKQVERKADSRAIYHGPKGPKNSSKGDGSDGKAGDKGRRDGSTTGTSYTGNPGKGGGQGGDEKGPIKFSLAGRKMVLVPTIDDNSQEAGTVAVRITVDDKGNVVQANYTQSGSTTSSSLLIKKAIAGARIAKFSPSDAIEQIGIIYIRFGLK